MHPTTDLEDASMQSANFKSLTPLLIHPPCDECNFPKEQLYEAVCMHVCEREVYEPSALTFPS